MADLPTRDELFRRFRAAAIATPRTRISPREIDRPGSDVNLIDAGSSLLGEELVNRMARALGAAFEDTATGEALDRVIFDRKGLPRLPAAPAVGTVQLTRPTFGAGAGVVQGNLPGFLPPPTRIQTNQGITYLLTQSAVFGALDLGPITVNAQADLAGLDFEVAEDQQWSFVDAPFDSSIVVTNPGQMAGAAPEETDTAYRARAKAFFPTIRRGTLGAIEFGCRSTPGVASVSVLEVTHPSGQPACSVQAFILDALGRANQTLAARVLLTLADFRAAGIPVTVVAGVPEFVPIQLLLSFDTSIILDTVRAAEDVAQAIIAALNNQQPGQILYRSTIIAAARTIRGVVIEDSDLLNPAGTLLPASLQSTFRTRRELLLFT